MPEFAFELLARQQISKFEHPSLKCAELVFNELQQVLQISDLMEFRRFEKLGKCVRSVAHSVLCERLESTQSMIKDLIQIELAYINTSHPDFSNKSCAATVTIACGSSGADGTANQSPPTSVSIPRETGEAQLEGGPLGAGKFGREVAEAPKPEAAKPAASPGGFFSGLAFFRQSTPVRSSAPKQDGSSIDRCAASEERAQMPAIMLPPALRVAAPTATSRTLRVDWGTDQALKLPQLPPPAVTVKTLAPTPQELAEVDIIMNLLEKYITIVKKNIADSVPKVIISFMVAGLKDALHKECITKLYKEPLFAELLGEAHDVQERRGTCEGHAQALRNALEVIESVQTRVDM